MPWVDGDRLNSTNLNNKLPSGLAISVTDAAYGAVGDGVTDDTTAIQAAITAATATQAVVYFPPGTYRYTSTITIPRGVKLRGEHTPAPDTQDLSLGTVLLRDANIIGFQIRGTNRITDRVGYNRISGIRFLDTANISALATFDCYLADCLVWEDVTFWQADSTTTVGHAVQVEECWDWKWYNVLWKQCGLSSSSKYCLYIFNGNDNNSNDFYFYACRWQESGGTSVFFDSSGTGHRCTLFHFVTCKFEDARAVGVRTATDHVDGDASNVTFVSTQFAGTTTRHARVRSVTGQWVFLGCPFYSVASGQAESLLIEGSGVKVIGCVFNDMTLTQFINISGGGNSVIGCTTFGSTPLTNSDYAPETNLLLNGEEHTNLTGSGDASRIKWSAADNYWDIRGDSGVAIRLGPTVSVGGGTPVSSEALRVDNSLTLTGATALYGVLAQPTFGADGTNTAQVIATQPRSQATTYTVNQVYGFRALDGVRGSGSTIGTLTGVQVEDQTVGQNNFAIRTGAGLVRFGDGSQLTSGTAVAPALAFSSESSLGLYRSAASIAKQSYGWFAADFISSSTTAQSGATARLPNQGQLYFSVLSLTSNGGEFGFRSGNTVYRFASVAVG